MHKWIWFEHEKEQGLISHLKSSCFHSVDNVCVYIYWWQYVSPPLCDWTHEGVTSKMVKYNLFECLWNSPFCSSGHEFSMNTLDIFFHFFHGRQKILQRKERVFTHECRIRLQIIIMIKVRYRRKYKMTWELVVFTANAPGLWHHL